MRLSPTTSAVSAEETPGTTPSPGTDRSSGGFRPDVQGLRAFAVIVVILDHLFRWPSGGFVGVDVFFVISGYLITGLLLRERGRTGRISFRGFYRRRLRRIVPMALLVLVVTYLAASLLFLGAQARATGADAIWAALFSANWRFAITGTDYMQADGPISPLRHYWSLSVEEQFYLVWPVMIVLVLGIAARWGAWRSETARRILGTVMALVVTVSVLFALWEVDHSPTVAYFSTFSRAWELGVGGLIAVATPMLARIPAWLQPYVQWVGLAGLATSVFLLGPHTPFPLPGAALPVVATALVITGGVGGPRLVFPLTNRVSRYVGDISYSLYLWHFPLFVLLGAALPADSRRVPLLALAGTVLLSVLSYHLWENPIRRSTWLEPTAKVTSRRRARRVVGVTAAMAVLGAVGLVTVRNSSAGDPLGDPAAFTTDTQLAAEIRTALATSTWPSLTPAPADLGRQGFVRADSQGCRPATPKGKDCRIRVSDPSKLAVVVGDSIAVAWLPAIRDVLEPRGWTVHSMAYVGCPFLDAETSAGDDSIIRSCPGHREIVRSLIAELKPGLVIVSNAYRQRFVHADNAASLKLWEPAARSARQNWLSPAGRIVAIQPPPAGPDPKSCITRLSTPRDCVTSLTSETSDYSSAEQRVWGSGNSRYIGTAGWFCATDGRCPIFAGGILIRRDPTHLTTDYAHRLAPLLDRALAAALTK